MKIDSSKKEGYIAGAIFLLAGVLFLVMGFDQGWATGKIMIIIGAFFGVTGGLGIKFPEVGEIIWHYMQNLGEDEKPSIRSSQNNPKSSPNATGHSVNQKNVYINNYGYSKKKSRYKKR